MVVVLDLDGVLWLGEEPLEGAAAAVARLRAAGVPVLFLTNNSSLPIPAYVAKLAGMGVPATADEILTSAVAGAHLLAADLPLRARVLVVGEEGILEALRTAGLEPVAEGPCDAVIVGICRTFDYWMCDRAQSAIRAGARFVATNMDPTYPAPHGLVPGAGAIVAAITAAAGVAPVVAGKPHPPTVELLRERIASWGHGPAVGIMVGDRPTTDGALAQALGWPFALVRSDVSATVGEEAIVPAIAADSLAGLVEPILDRVAAAAHRNR
jgi:HAD superfamily hydrolase (TIGR01450 family)